MTALIDEDGGESEEQEQGDGVEGLCDEHDNEDGGASEEQQDNNLEDLCDEDEDSGASKEQGQENDDLEGLFDEDDEEEEYKDGIEGDILATEDVVTELFGDVDDIQNEEKDAEGKAERGGENPDVSKEELQGLCWNAFRSDSRFEVL